VEALLAREKVYPNDRPLQSEIFIHPTKVECQEIQMDVVD
jgi:hypothetical protein